MIENLLFANVVLSQDNANVTTIFMFSLQLQQIGGKNVEFTVM